MLSRRIATAASLIALAVLVLAGAGTSSAFAGEAAHPFLFSFGSFSNPNGIAIDQSGGDVYVADIGTNTVYKFDANGHTVNFTNGAAAGTNALTGADTPVKAFSFPDIHGTPAAIAVDNACVEHTPALTGKDCEEFDPSAGDLYVMDAGHNVIDKFKSNGEYLNQITGSSTGEPFTGPLLGVAVDGRGDLHVYIGLSKFAEWIYLFDDSVINGFVTHLDRVTLGAQGAAKGAPEPAFTTGANGDDYLLFGCGCVEKFGGNLEQLGRVDSGPDDVAVAVDPATEHLYVDDESTVTEWDTGSLNGSAQQLGGTEDPPGGALASSFGSPWLSGSLGQGGIAVNGESGDIYVSNPSNGKVYVFGTSTPGVAVAAPAQVTRTGAALQGAVDPHGSPVTECKFEYESVSLGSGNSESLELVTPVSSFAHVASCNLTPAQIGSGTSPVPVTANVSELQPGLLYDFRLVAGNVEGSDSNSGRFAAAGPGFGIKPGGFEVSFFNEDGTPDTQAGSHPYKMVTNIPLNTQAMRREVVADSRYVIEPDGNVKDIVVDLPPGLVGDPNATTEKCTLRQLEGVHGEEAGGGHCPIQAIVGELEVEFGAFSQQPIKEPVYLMVPPHGVAVQIGAQFILPNTLINAGVLAGGDYPVQATSLEIPTILPIISTRLTVFGVVGENNYESGKAGSANTLKPFLTLPTGCTGPLRSSISVSSWQEPNHPVEENIVTRDAAGEPLGLTGCAKLEFPPTITVVPDTTDASTSSGLTVGVHVSQGAALNAKGLAESALRDTTVTLPEGVAINPAGANGLEACSEGLAGFEIGHGVDGSGFEEFNPEFEPGVKTATFTPEMPEPLQPGVNFCPNGSKIGTVKIKTPLLTNPLEGAVYLAVQNANPFGSLVAMYMIVEDPISGSIVKLTGEVHLTATGQIVTTFKNTPDLPFEELELHFFGGERAPLSTPSRCGTYTTTASFVPWDGNGPVNTSSSFQITSGPNGSPCPGASLPFHPSLTGGATNVNAGAFSPFTLTMTRKDGEQNLQSVEAHLPPGLSGILSNIELCHEPQANLGECPPNSLIGESTISVGVGNQPFTVSGGKFYLTGPYNGSGGCTVGQPGCAPFGITFEVPAKAGPFDLKRNTANPSGEDPCDCVIVRGKIEVNPITAAITITSDPPGSPYAIPTSIEGIPLEIQHVNAITTRGDFQFNPTNCNKMEVTGTIHSSEGALDTIGVPFQVTNCAVLGFKPAFKVSTSGKTSRANGASLSVKLTYPKAPFGSQANIRSVKVDLPKQLPSRLTTLQKACPAKTFEANPAGCAAASIVGHAKAITPLIPVPLEGPAYFVSYGGAKFPELVVVLQGYGVTLDLHGETFISKAGITSSTFHTIPDAPVGSFELTLPQGKYSALAANGNLCKSTLKMPTAFTAQNGATIKQSTPIGVTGCAKHKAKKKTKRHKGKTTHGKKK